jgi:hypothetical protein
MAIWPFGKQEKHREGTAPRPIDATFRFEQTDRGREAFFRLQCEFGDTNITVGKGMVAIVLDASREFPGIPYPVKIEPDGKQLALIKVISEDGGFIVPTTTPSAKGDRLVPGDVVMWVPSRYEDTAAQSSPDKRFGWVGLIRAKVDWGEWSGPKSSFNINCRYDP